MTAAVLYPDCPPQGATSTTGIRVEPLVPGDLMTVQQVFHGLGARSRELRFLAAKPRLTSADLRSLTDVDGHDRVALVARHDDCPIGIARFVRDTEDPASADVAVAVVDAWQDRSVGTRLAHALLERAQELGITRFSIAIAHENEAAIRLMHRIAGSVSRVGWEGGVVEFEASATAGRSRGRAVLKGGGM